MRPYTSVVVLKLVNGHYQVNRHYLNTTPSLSKNRNHLYNSNATYYCVIYSTPIPAQPSWPLLECSVSIIKINNVIPKSLQTAVLMLSSNLKARPIKNFQKTQFDLAKPEAQMKIIGMNNYDPRLNHQQPNLVIKHRTLP